MLTRINYDAVRQDGDIAPVNVQKTLARGVSFVKSVQHHDKPLAIVGGGPSFLDSLEELRSWPGDIWAVNATCRELRSHGIESVGVTVDPHEDMWRQFDGIGEGLFASCCTAKLFDMYGDRCKAFHFSDDDNSGLCAKGGGTSASSMHMIAFALGYGEIHYFGCEGSYEDKTHGYDYEDPGPWVLIKANGKEFKTKPYLEMQTVFLSTVMREFPEAFKNRSGGLLDAMIKDQDWTIVDCHNELKPFLTDFERAA